jgi:CubicO group peptidase (beta-lactamase class C family)
MYCNTNFALLALIVEKVTATPFPEAMQEIVFKPLKMNHTFIFRRKIFQRLHNHFTVASDYIL